MNEGKALAQAPQIGLVCPDLSFFVLFGIFRMFLGILAAHQTAIGDTIAASGP